MTTNRRSEETKIKDTKEQQKEGFMRAIQKQRRRRSVRKILQTFSAQRRGICHKPLNKTRSHESHISPQTQ